MPLFDVYRVFETGKNAGKLTKNPVDQITADTIEDAKSAYVGKKKNKYEFKKAKQVLTSKKSVAKESWEIGERAWFQISEWDPTWIAGRIHELRTDSKDNAYAVIWEDSNGSWRYPFIKNLRTAKPKAGKTKRKNKELSSKAQSLTKPVSRVKRKK